MRHKVGFSKKANGWIIFMMMPAFLLLFSTPAMAVCEQGNRTNDAVVDYVEDIFEHLDNFLIEIGNFIEHDLESTATEEVLERLDEYDTNLYTSLNDWWDDGTGNPSTSTLPALQEMTRQISLAKVDQTRQIGSFFDAMLLNEALRERRRAKAESHQRYSISEASCQLDSLGKSYAHTRAYRFSRAMARSIASVDTKRRNNHVDPNKEPMLAQSEGNIFVRPAYAEVRPTPPGGVPADLLMTWHEYTDNFCDPSVGDQGCDAAGNMPGEHTDIPALLWGDSQTIDVTNEDNLTMMEAALRTLISPFISPVIPPVVLRTPRGQALLLERRSHDARLNTIYNAMGQMISERTGGPGTTGANTRELREAAGLSAIPPATATEDGASYSEVRDTMARARVMNPEFIVRLVHDTSSVERELTTVNAIGQQVMSDLYKRLEEMMMMEAALYAATLDAQVP